MEGVVPLGGCSGDRAFYALELSPLIVKVLGVLDPIVHIHWHVREPIDLFEDFQVYSSLEVVDCGF